MTDCPAWTTKVVSINRTFQSVQCSAVSPRLLASSSLADGLFDERYTARSTAVLRTDDDGATSLPDASAAAYVTAGPATPGAQYAIHRPCMIHVSRPILHRQSLRGTKMETSVQSN